MSGRWQPVSHHTSRSGEPIGSAAMPDGARVVCDQCGLEATDDEGDPPLAWSSEMVDGTVRWACPVCTRDHVRFIEGKLSQDHW